jgi:hypothetical protein
MSGGNRFETGTVLGDESLVRGHDRGAASEETSDECSRRLYCVECVDNNIVVAAQERGSVGREMRRSRAAAKFGRISYERVIDVEANAGMCRNTAVGRQAGNGLADLPEAE